MWASNLLDVPCLSQELETRHSSWPTENKHSTCSHGKATQQVYCELSAAWHSQQCFTVAQVTTATHAPVFSPGPVGGHSFQGNTQVHNAESYSKMSHPILQLLKWMKSFHELYNTRIFLQRRKLLNSLKTPHSLLLELGTKGRRLTTKKMDGTAIDMAQMKLTHRYLLNFPPQNWSFNLSLLPLIRTRVCDTSLMNSPTNEGQGVGVGARGWVQSNKAHV